MTARKGNGKLRHVRIGHLWIQDLADSESVSFQKVRGVSNPADLMTKHLAGVKSAEVSAALFQQPRAGHASCRIALNGLLTQRVHVFPSGRAQEAPWPSARQDAHVGRKDQKT